MQGNRLRPIGDDIPASFFGDGTAEPLSSPVPPPPPPRPSSTAAEQQAATGILMLALRALSQRAVTGVANLFVLLGAASAFWLWLTILPSPSILQIVAVSIYGMLMVVLDWMVLHRYGSDARQR